MRYEILRCKNGYIVMPQPDYHSGRGFEPELFWVFQTYEGLTDKLPEILNQPPKADQ